MILAASYCQGDSRYLAANEHQMFSRYLCEVFHFPKTVRYLLVFHTQDGTYSVLLSQSEMFITQIPSTRLVMTVMV